MTIHSAPAIFNVVTDANGILQFRPGVTDSARTDCGHDCIRIRDHRAVTCSVCGRLQAFGAAKPGKRASLIPPGWRNASFAEIQRHRQAAKRAVPWNHSKNADPIIAIQPWLAKVSVELHRRLKRARIYVEGVQ